MAQPRAIPEYAIGPERGTSAPHAPCADRPPQLANTYLELPLDPDAFAPPLGYQWTEIARVGSYPHWEFGVQDVACSDFGPLTVSVARAVLAPRALGVPVCIEHCATDTVAWARRARYNDYHMAVFLVWRSIAAAERVRGSHPFVSLKWECPELQSGRIHPQRLVHIGAVAHPNIKCIPPLFSPDADLAGLPVLDGPHLAVLEELEDQLYDG